MINNAGIMNIDDVSTAVDERLLVSTHTTNLLGPIRMTGALIPGTSSVAHLRENLAVGQ